MEDAIASFEDLVNATSQALNRLLDGADSALDVLEQYVFEPISRVADTGFDLPSYRIDRDTDDTYRVV